MALSGWMKKIEVKDLQRNEVEKNKERLEAIELEDLKLSYSLLLLVFTRVTVVPGIAVSGGLNLPCAMLYSFFMKNFWYLSTYKLTHHRNFITYKLYLFLSKRKHFPPKVWFKNSISKN